MKILFVLTMALVLGTSVSMAQGVTTKKVETENRTSLPQAPVTPTAKKKTVGSKTGTQGWMSDDIVMPDKPVNEKTGKTVKTAKTVGTKTSKTVGTKTGTQGWMSDDIVMPDKPLNEGKAKVAGAVKENTDTKR